MRPTGKNRLVRLPKRQNNVAKRYKLPQAAVDIIKQAGKIYGRENIAIVVAVELIWRPIGKDFMAPASIQDTPLTGKTYRIPLRTIGLIGALAHGRDTKREATFSPRVPTSYWMTSKRRRSGKSIGREFLIALKR